MPQITPIASTYVSQAVPIPDGVGASLGNYVTNMLAAEQRIEGQQDALSQMNAEILANRLVKDNDYTQQILGGVETELGNLAEADSMTQSRGLRVLSRRTASALAPVQQRFRRRAEALAAIPPGLDPQDRIAAEALIDREFGDLTPEAIERGTFLPDANQGRIAAPQDLTGRVDQLVSGIREQIEEGSFESADYGMIGRTTTREIQEQAVQAEVEHALRNRGDAYGSWAWQQAQFRAQRSGKTPEQELTALIDAEKQRAVGKFARRYEQTATQQDPTLADNTDSDAPDPGDTSLRTDTQGDVINWGSTSSATPSDRELTRRMTAVAARMAPPAPIAMEAATISRLMLDSAYRDTVMRQVTARRGPEYDRLQIKSPREGIAVLDYLSRLSSLSGNVRSTALRDYQREQNAGSNTSNNFVHYGISLGTPDEIRDMRSVFARATANPGGTTMYEKSGGGVNRLTNSDRTRGFSNMDSVRSLSPDPEGRLFLEVVASNEDGEQRTFLIQPHGSNMAQWVGERILEGAPPGSEQQMMGQLYSAEGRHPGSGPLSFISSLRADNTWRNVPGISGIHVGRRPNRPDGTPRYMVRYRRTPNGPMVEGEINNLADVLRGMASVLHQHSNNQ